MLEEMVSVYHCCYGTKKMAETFALNAFYFKKGG